jgi:predicted transposase YdaD
MCTALKELEEKCYAEGVQEGEKKGMQQGMQQGKQEGLREGEIKGTIKMCRKFGLNQAATMESIQKDFAMTEAMASAYVGKYW